MVRAATILLMFFSTAPAMRAQSLGDAAERERARRERQGETSGRVFTNDDLGKPFVQNPRSPGLPVVPDRHRAPARAVPPGAFDTARHAAHARHLASADEYLRRAEFRLREAEVQFRLVEASAGPALDQARRDLARASRAVERARRYRNQAAIAARNAGLWDSW